MTTGWALNRSLERLQLVADASLDHRSLRTGVLAELGRVLPFDAFVWPLCDPATATGISPRAHVPCPEELPLLIRLKYLTRKGRWTQLAGTASPVMSLLRGTGGDPSRSMLWDGVLKRYGVKDVLSTVFDDKHGCWGWLDLWRVGEQGGFTSGEAAYLAAAVRVVTPAVRRSVARQFGLEVPELSLRPDDKPDIQPDIQSRGSSRNGGKRSSLPEQAVLTLDADMAVVGQTASAGHWLELLQPGPRPYHGVPAEVLNVAAQLLAREAGVDDHPASARVHIGSGIGSGRWAILRASRMGSASPGATPPLAVTIQECPAESRLDIFARSFGLTHRQRELLELAATGADTAAMAVALGIGAYTVQDQFKQVFDNCGVHSRASLLAMALGTG
ncbi:MAG TPA: helix-turn-helix transcriptional regulator [Arthrobacter sp.]|jgi:DNA-binding CsgD family transcriptional regulator